MTDYSYVTIMAAVNLDSAFNLINWQALNIDGVHDYKELTDTFRYLRNLCTNPDIQKVISKNVSILQNTCKIFSSFQKRNEDEVLCLQVGLQFLGNLVVNSKANQERVWITFRDVLRSCLDLRIPKVQTYTAMILYNIFLGSPEFLDEFKEPLDSLIEMTLSETTSEYPVFILELFILKSDYVINFYDDLKQGHKLIILEIIKNLVVDQNNTHLSPQIIKFLSDKFRVNSDCILKTAENLTETLDPIEVIKILDLLVAFSSDDRQCYFDFIVKEISLLINGVMLLRNVHSVSKQKGNNFTMITKISEVDEVERNTSIQEHPIFGFKCSLIRLIGNLCWRNLENQNKVRELEGVSVLLDCCNIDARNPFITQWCILAIRNLCENNVENQKVIGSMSKEGKIDAGILREMGITLNTNPDGGSICIAPLS